MKCKSAECVSHKEAHLSKAVLQPRTFVAPATMREHQAALKAVWCSPRLLQLRSLCRGLGVIIGAAALKLPCWKWQPGMALGAARNCPQVRVMGLGKNWPSCNGLSRSVKHTSTVV